MANVFILTSKTFIPYSYTDKPEYSVDVYVFSTRALADAFALLQRQQYKWTDYEITQTILDPADINTSVYITTTTES